jgi:hypothetical protein
MNSNTDYELMNPETIAAEPLPFVAQHGADAPARQLPEDLRVTPHDIELPAIDVTRMRSTQRRPTFLMDYEPVPPLMPGRVPTGAAIWRIELRGPDPDSEPMGFDVYDDAVIGRGTHAHIRLDEVGAGEMGVSRRHAVLRPTRDHLYLIDIGSANGTFLNYFSAAPSTPMVIENDDVITLGGLSFVVKIIIRPIDRTYYPTQH